MNIPRKYFFKPGNKFGTHGGRPPKAKSQIERIRNRILRVVKRRIMHETDLNTVSTTDLLKFMAAIMPRDWIQMNAPQINYISNVPREEIIEQMIPPMETPAEENPAVLLPEKSLDEQQPVIPQL